jgi:periplasmic divalent cation tolerance protein
MEDTYIIVLTTVSTRQFATDLARSIVHARLAACVQLQSVQSVYGWKGEVCVPNRSGFWRLRPPQAGISMSWSGTSALNHSYETPEIVRVPITGGSSEYLAWISDSVDADQFRGGLPGLT